MNFTPRGNLIHIRINRHPNRRPSGLWLPETAHHTATEGTVISTGPGTWVPETGEFVMVWVLEGDIILYPEHLLRPLSDPGEGVVAESDLLATVDPTTDTLLPEGEWVLIDPDPPPGISRGGIALAERAREVPRSGVVVDAGPGELRLRGPYAGLRWPVRSMLGLDPAEPFAGRRVFWDKAAVVMWAGGQALVPARRLLFLTAAEPWATEAKQGKESGLRLR